MMHLSRQAEELILWSTPEFGFVKLHDSVTTGSSIMPQKKNPDVAELIRGRVGRVYGALMGALTMLKALPLSYNRDLQEDKHFLFEGIDTTESCLRLMTLQLKTAEFRKEKMAENLHGDFSNATDLADYLVTKSLPFRQAHEIAGQIVKHCIEKKCGIENLNLNNLKKHSNLFESDVVEKLKPVSVMKARTSQGGTGLTSVWTQIQNAKKLIGFKT
jgi:argininosuccinate lyase